MGSGDARQRTLAYGAQPGRERPGIERLPTRHPGDFKAHLPQTFFLRDVPRLLDSVTVVCAVDLDRGGAVLVDEVDLAETSARRGEHDAVDQQSWPAGVLLRHRADPHLRGRPGAATGPGQRPGHDGVPPRGPMRSDVRREALERRDPARERGLEDDECLAAVVPPHLVEDGSLRTRDPDAVATPDLPLRQSLEGDGDVTMPSYAAAGSDRDADGKRRTSVARQAVEPGRAMEQARGPTRDDRGARQSGGHLDDPLLRHAAIDVARHVEAAGRPHEGRTSGPVRGQVSPDPQRWHHADVGGDRVPSVARHRLQRRGDEAVRAPRSPQARKLPNSRGLQRPIQPRDCSVTRGAALSRGPWRRRRRASGPGTTRSPLRPAALKRVARAGHLAEQVGQPGRCSRPSLRWPSCRAGTPLRPSPSRGQGRRRSR